LENIKKRQVLIVSSPRPQRKRAAIASRDSIAGQVSAWQPSEFERPSCLQRFPQVAIGASHYTKTPVDGQQEFGMLSFFLLTV